jgi:hypothetical protein
MLALGSYTDVVNAGVTHGVGRCLPAGAVGVSPRVGPVDEKTLCNRTCPTVGVLVCIKC